MPREGDHVEVERVISDHAGTVLDEAEPEPSLTRAEETKAIEVFQYHDKLKTGLPLDSLKAVLPDLDIRLADELFAEHVHAYFQGEGISVEEGKLGQARFLDLVSRVYAPAHKFGARLRKAAGRGDDGLVRSLICRGCTPLGTDGGGYNSLHYAAQHNRASTINVLLELAGPRSNDLLNATDNSLWTPLMVAATNGRVDAVDQLLSHGATRDCVSQEGRSALHWAACKGKTSVVGTLVSAGLSVKDADNSGWTPLHCAMLHGHIQTGATLVVDFDADMLDQDELGNTPEKYCSAEVWQGLLTEIERRKSNGEGGKKKKR